MGLSSPTVNYKLSILQLSNSATNKATEILLMKSVDMKKTQTCRCQILDVHKETREFVCISTSTSTPPNQTKTNMINVVVVNVNYQNSLKLRSCLHIKHKWFTESS